MSETEIKGSYLLIKTSLIVFNGAQIFHQLFTLAFIYNLFQVDTKTSVDINNSYEDHMADNGTKQMILVPFYIRSIMLMILYLIGIYGTIREHKGILMSYGLVLAVITFFYMFSSHFKLSLWIIYVVMSSLAIGFSLIIQYRSEQMQQIYIPKV